MASVLITGANRVLGIEFVRQYAADGWRVWAACRDPKSANELQRSAQDARGMLTVVTMNVTDVESVRAAARQLTEVAIDVLITLEDRGAPGQGGRPLILMALGRVCVTMT